MTVMQRLDSQAADFNAALERLLAWEGVSDAALQATVNEVIARVRGEGDLAVV
ncbi:MAG: histidinol dehydrogenase, partial [Perlucidibaca sp.]